MRSILAGLHQLEHLPELAVALGFAATWHECVMDEAMGDGPMPRRMVVVGRRGSLLCLAVEGDRPESLARWLAQAMRRRGRTALVLALSDEARRLAIGVAGPRVRVMEVGLDHPTALELGILGHGAQAAGDTALGLAALWADALEGERLGTRFFVRFQSTLDRFIEAYPHRMARRDRHGLALLQLTRVLFLYFVQQKGWLGGSGRFLGNSVDECLAAGRDLHRRLLHPLFFGTLNRPAAERSARTRRFGPVPFLNGGLFEPHPLEHRWRVTLPNEVWRVAFDELFERFHFTVDGTNGGGQAIAPDMLGRVFERVMDPDERHRSGTFYTPAELVEALVERSFTQWLSQQLRVDDARAHQLLQAPDPNALALLRGVRVIDPTVGSGAFLLGALSLLVRSRMAGGEPKSVATRRVVARNLFGVDLNPAAVRLTELRLWLAVIDADGDRPVDQVLPLPNLDSLIRQGDSLVEPVARGIHAAPRESAVVARLRSTVVAATGPAKRAALRELRRAELQTLESALGRLDVTLERQIEELEAAGASPGLFGEPRGLRRDERRQLDDWVQERKRIRRIARRIEMSGEVPWFHFDTHFADVMHRGGFDVLLGNPPWVRAEKLAPAYRRTLHDQYRWYRSGVRGGFAHWPDLSVAFLERATQLVRPGGVIGLLLPSKLLSATYGRVAREELARRFTVHTAADLQTDRRARFEATVYPLALIVTNQPPPERHGVAASLDPEPSIRLPQTALDGAPWIIRSHRLHDALHHVRTAHPTLGERFTCHLGIKTGANHLFLDPPDEIEPELVRPALRGRDVEPFRAQSAIRLLWTHSEDGSPKAQLPPNASAHFRRHQAQLVRRRDYQRGPVWTVFRTGGATAPYRVVWADLAQRLGAAALLQSPAIPLNSCYVINARSEESALVLAAWLNSRWLGAIARSIATPAANGFARYNAATVSALPWPIGLDVHGDFLAVARAAHQRGDGDAELDRLVGQLLGVSPELLDGNDSP